MVSLDWRMKPQAGKRKGKKSRNKQRPTVGRCRDCKETRFVLRGNWGSPNAPRCYGCGGMLDRV